MTAQEHEAQGSHEQSLTSDEKLQRVRDGLSGATRLKYMMDELAEEIDKDKEDIDSLNAALASKQTRHHDLSRQRESLVGLEQLAEIVNQEESVTDGEEAIVLAMAIHDASGNRKSVLSVQEVRDRFRRAKEGQEIGVFDARDRARVYGPLVQDAEVVIPRHAIGMPVKFRIAIGGKDDAAPVRGEVAPEMIAFGKEGMVEHYLESVTDEEGGYVFEEGIRDDYANRQIDALESAAAMIKLGHCDDERIAAYHDSLFGATRRLIQERIAYRQYGDFSDLGGLLEGLYKVMPPQEFSTLYDLLISEGADPERVVANVERKNYLHTMEKLVARMQNPEKEHLAELDVARARVTVLEEISVKRASMYPLGE